MASDNKDMSEADTSRLLGADTLEVETTVKLDYVNSPWPINNRIMNHDKTTLIKSLKERLAMSQERCKKLERLVASASGEDKRAAAASSEEELKQKVSASEKKCARLQEEKVTLQKEIDELKTEMAEVYDTFKEEETEEYRELQRQLDDTSKNARIAHYRLKKAEKKNEQLEYEKRLLQDKLYAVSRQRFDTSASPGSEKAVDLLVSPDELDLVQELRLAKEVSVRLNNELEMTDERRTRSEEENQILRRKLLEVERKQMEYKRQIKNLEAQANRESGPRTQNPSSTSFEELEFFHEQMLDILRDNQLLSVDLERYRNRYGALDNVANGASQRGKKLEQKKSSTATSPTASLTSKAYSLTIAADKESIKKNESEKEEADLTGNTQTKAAEGEGHQEVTKLKQKTKILKIEADSLRRLLSQVTEKNNDLQTQLREYQSRVRSQPKEPAAGLAKPTLILNKDSKLEKRTKTSTTDQKKVLVSPTSPISSEGELQLKIGELQQEAQQARTNVLYAKLENESLREALKRYKDSETKKRQVSGSNAGATPSESEAKRLSALQEKVSALEEQLGKLLLIVKKQEEELQISRVVFEKTSSEAKSNQEELKTKLNMASSQQEALESQLKMVEKRAQRLQQDLNNTSNQLQQDALDNNTSAATKFAMGGATPASGTYSEEDYDPISIDTDLLREKMLTLEDELDKERKRRDVAEKKVLILSENLEDGASGNEKEIELLKFELNESQTLLADAQEELIQFKITLAKEKSERLKERAENEQKQVQVNKEQQGSRTTASSQSRADRREFEKLKQRLEKEVQELNRSCTKLRKDCDDLQKNLGVLTAENEELKASHDILIRERAHLRGKMTEAQQEKCELEIKLKKSKENWQKEKDNLIFNEDSERKKRENELRKTQDDYKKLMEQKNEADVSIKALKERLEVNLAKLSDLTRKEEAWKREKESFETKYTNNAEYDKKVQSLLSENTVLTNQILDNENAWKIEKERLAEVMETLKRSLKAREASWETERQKFTEELMRLNYETAKSETDVKLSKSQTSQNSVKEDQFETEEKQQQIDMENYDKEIQTLKFEKEHLIKQIAEKEEDWNKAKRKVEEASKQEYKVLQKKTRAEGELWKAKSEALQLRLDSETSHMRSEVSRLRSQLESEIREKDLSKQSAAETEERLVSLKESFEKSRQFWTKEVENLQRISAEARDSKKVIDELKRAKEATEFKLASEEKRGSEVQKTYAREKSTWQIEKSELISRVERLEQQVKSPSKKSKVEEARIQASFDKERSEQRRLLALSHEKNMELERQLELMKRTLETVKVELAHKLETEKREWAREKGHLLIRIRQLEEEKRILCEEKTQLGHTLERYHQEKESWREEKTKLENMLIESERTKRKELEKMDHIFSEFHKLKELTLTSPVSPSVENYDFFPTRDIEPRNSAKLATGSGIVISKTPFDSNTEQSQQHSISQIDQDANTIQAASDSPGELRKALDEAMRKIAEVTDDLANCEEEMAVEYKVALKRSQSHSDVAGETKTDGKQLPNRAASFSRKERLVFPPTELAVSGATAPPSSKVIHDPVITRPGHFKKEGILRETDKKSPSLPWMSKSSSNEPRVVSDSELTTNRVTSVKKKFVSAQEKPALKPKPQKKDVSKAEETKEENKTPEKASAAAGRIKPPLPAKPTTLVQPAREMATPRDIAQEIAKRSKTLSKSPAPRTESASKSDDEVFLRRSGGNKGGSAVSSPTKPAQLSVYTKSSPSRSGSETEAAGIIPGNLPKTKSQIQSQDFARQQQIKQLQQLQQRQQQLFLRQANNLSGKDETKKAVEESKKLSPRSARAHFFAADISRSPTAGVKENPKKSSASHEQKSLPLIRNPINVPDDNPNLRQTKGAVPTKQSSGGDESHKIAKKSNESSAASQSAGVGQEDNALQRLRVSEQVARATYIPPLTGSTRFPRPRPSSRRRPPSRWQWRNNRSVNFVHDGAYVSFYSDGDYQRPTALRNGGERLAAFRGSVHETEV